MKLVPLRSRPRQAGAATLVVVMVLFFIISLVAAYTSRNLIFEQRTSTNQYRSTQALEAADAGMEWAISMLNHGRITDSCTTSASGADLSFRERYLNIDATTGKITPVLSAAGVALQPSCVNTPTGWSCSCPTTGLPTISAPTAAGVWPAFRVRFRSVVGEPGTPFVPRQPGVVKLEVVGCTRVDPSGGEQCLSFDGRGALNEGRVLASSMVALTGNPTGPPVAALTARGAVDVGGAALTAVNSAPSGMGITVHSGGAINSAGLVLRTAPGSPAAASIIESDTAFALPATGTFTTSDRMFATVFNMRPQTFQTQQAAVTVNCPLAGCSATAVRDALALNPMRPLWLTGSLNVDSAGDIGTAANPVVLIVNGDLQFSTAGVTIYGLVFNRLAVGTANWTTAGAGQVTGAVVAEGGVGGSGTPTIVYDESVLRLLRTRNGSFVRVPGSWKDFR